MAEFRAPYHRSSKVLLNWDTILTLSEHLSRTSLVALMSTCKELRRYGVRFLLGEDKPISFSRPKDIDSLCLFMNSNIPEGTGGRAAHIRMLDLRTKAKLWTYKESFQTLGDVLRQASGLYALDIGDDALAAKALRDVLVGENLFPALRRLGIENVSARCKKFATGLLPHVPLSALVISKYVSGLGAPSELPALLRACSGTLEELHIGQWTVRPTPQDATAVVSHLTGASCTRVHTLSLLPAPHAGLEHDAGALIGAFPALRRLTLAQPPGVQPLPALPTDAQRRHYTPNMLAHMGVGVQFATDASWRERNETAQRQQRWQTLEYLCGPLAHLHVLSLRVQVQHLVVTSVPLVRARIQEMHAVVRDCAPTKLTFVVRDLEKKDSELVELVPATPPRAIRYLQIDLCTWTDADQLLSELRLLGLGTGTVRTLVIRISPGVEMTYRKALDAEAAHEEYEKFAIQTAQVSKSLRHVGLPSTLFGPLPKLEEPADPWSKEYMAPRPSETLFWEIERADDGPIYVDKVPPKKAAALLETQTFVASSPFEY